MLKERLKSRVFEYKYGPYWNPWFLVKKGEGTKKYRIINVTMEVNKVTIWDVNLPPTTDEFAKEFASNNITSLIDWFSRYD